MATRKPPVTRRPDDIGEFDLPPFPGFDKEGLRFLRELKANNTREWMTEERKRVYRDHLQEPMKFLLGELAARFRDSDLPFSPDPKNGIFRLYRDTRFSNDKTPYKTHIGAAIPYLGEGREGIGNYLHIEPGKSFYGGGAYFIDSAGLRNLRAAVASDPDRLRRILRDVERDIGPLEGERLKRAPAGYDESHPAIDLLRYKQMWAGRNFPDKLATSRELVDWIVDTTAKSVEFNRYLQEAIRG